MARFGAEKLAPLFTQLGKRDVLTDQERDRLIGAFSSERIYAPGRDILMEGDRPTASQLLLEGVSGRYKVLANGGRQLTAVHVPGDFMDLHGFLLKRLAHGVVALSECRVALVDHETLRDISETAPHLSRMLWLDTLIDASIHREWIVAMGRLPADAQLGHFLCEMFKKLELVGQTEGHGFTLPLTQMQLADVLGISVVHVNRSLQSLRKLGLVT